MAYVVLFDPVWVKVFRQGCFEMRVMEHFWAIAGCILECPGGQCKVSLLLLRSAIGAFSGSSKEEAERKRIEDEMNSKYAPKAKKQKKIGGLTLEELHAKQRQ